MTNATALPVGSILEKSSSPAVIMSSPLPSTSRTPKRLTSPPARWAVTMIVSAMGRNVSPASSGERPEDLLEIERGHVPHREQRRR